MLNKRKHRKNYKPLLVIFLLLFAGWGSVGHKIINKSTTLSFPPAMNEFVSWESFLESHASDADNRKGSDPNEAPKHYIDIDSYPEFITTGRISQSYDSIVAQHGLTFVIDQGILPWAIINTTDSLKKAFQRHDWNAAKIHAADLGHYVGDGHMPLHITENYNGQLTNQYGIHSRYETTLIGKYTSQITYGGETQPVIDNVPDYVFSFLYSNYHYVDSVLKADSISKALTGSTSSTAYYTQFWNRTGTFTIAMFKNASVSLAALMYTAWVNAGSPSMVTSVDEDLQVSRFKLFDVYPNPFNPGTVINYIIPDIQRSISTTSNQKTEDVMVSLKVYDLLGREVSTLIHEVQTPGNYSLKFNASGLSTGIYLVELNIGSLREVKKIVLSK